jgi:hypothetical protein
MLFISGPLLKLDAVRRDRGYAENLHVRTFAEVSDNLCHVGAIPGGFETKLLQRRTIKIVL